jgi:uncharacterized protein (DUF885 family)
MCREILQTNRTMVRTRLIALFLLLLGCSSPLTSYRITERQPSPTVESRKLHELFDAYFEEYLRLNPVFATSVGDHRYDDQLGDGISEEHRQYKRLLLGRYLDELSRLDKETLNDGDRVSYHLFKHQLTLELKELEFNQHLLPVRQLFSTPIEFPLLGSGFGLHPFKTVGDYENFLARMEKFASWTDTAIHNMRKGMELGIVQPRFVIERTLPQLEAMLVSDAKQSIFYRPILRIPSGFSTGEADRITGQYAQEIERRVIPTYRKLHAFIKEEYLPKSRTSPALSALPNGDAWYSYLVRVHTTTDLPPDEIFRLGMKEVERINGEIEKLKEKLGFRGSSAELAATFAGAVPSYRTKEELIKAYEEISAKVTPRLAKLFGRIPKSRYEIRAIEEFRERSAPSQYWSASPDGSRPGIFYVNAAGINERPRRPSESLFLHEAMPGHHFQVSLQRENAELPNFRRFGRYTAFSEGWALYVESLGYELGLYSDPLQEFGRLNSELFRAVRLVVDVGLHQKGWTRQQAVDYMMQNTLMSESGAMLEIDRYIAWPAQALSYKIGQLKISAIRSKAEKSLGAKFDIRAFHDELLKDGAMPLDLLEAKMDAWIDSRE